MRSTTVVILVLFVVGAFGHMAVYTRSMWGIEPNNGNSNWAVEPLQDYNFSVWVCFTPIKTILNK